ncbi:MAG: helix-hairpin-helix domain-containing protein [Bacteroidota bacterium]|nr:helix-hairpin-helix domain-containing protein [Bacteroidota bacterium]
MDNYEIAKHFSLLSKLMDVHGENSLRSKTYSITAYRIQQLTVELQTLSYAKIFSINGIGEAIGKKIIELIETEKMQPLEELLQKTPEGILEMMKIKGIGPKKIAVIWKELHTESIGELLYACQENRLSLLKGFGKKTQDNVIESIEFFLKQQGNYLYAQVEQLALNIEQLFSEIFSSKEIKITGGFVRQNETVEELEYVIPFSEKIILEKISAVNGFIFLEKNDNYILYKYNDGIKIKLYPTTDEQFLQRTFETTNSAYFNMSFSEIFDLKKIKIAKDDEDIFKIAGLQYIPRCLRETGHSIDLAKQNKLPELIEPDDIKGIIHCHSNWSDGSNTLEQLAEACVNKGYEYLVISDHSKAASYAQGLSEEKVKAQHQLIDELNTKLYPFKIFKSIESDILNDGTLDYSNNVLSTFDLVIASVHSNLKMNEEKAMMRLLNAIENPYTTILGHMTGRLLLSRKGYPVDHKKIIDACAANNVVIEINAHPRRLDMSWTWIEYVLSKDVLVSIDPDAHAIEEFSNTRYGVLVAQKGFVTSKNNLSSFSLGEFEKFLKENKKNKKW